jgi:hypothetical protein
MTGFTSKVFVGVGAAWLALGAVDLWRGSMISGAFSILIGIASILTGLGLNPRSVRQRVMRRLSFGFLGVAVVFLVIWIVQSPPWT